MARLRDGDHVVVIGAGPAGLTAGLQLSRAGVAVTVLEADDVVGGISRTAQYRGFRFDIGGHRFFTKIAPVEALWRELLGKELISVPRLSRIHYGGRYFDYPLRAANALAGLGPLKALQILASYAWARLRPTPIEENFEQWVVNRFGRRLYEIFFKTYTEKVWGVPCTEIRSEWAAQRIQGLSLGRALLNATVLTNRASGIKSLIHEFSYPRLGPGQMWEICRDRISALGNRVLLRHRVVAVDRVGDQVLGVTADTPEGRRSFPADHVITTMDLKSLVSAIDPAPPAEAARAAANLRYRDFLVVALILDRDQLFPDNWIYVHTPGVRVGRIQNFKNWSAAMVPDPKLTCLGLEYFCFEGDELWKAEDAELVSLASRELEALGIAPASLVRDGTVVRVPKAYPLYDGSYRKHLGAVREFLDPIRNLHTVGRNGMHKYNNQDHSMLTAMMVVANMQGAGHEVWDVNTDYEYHEEQRLDLAPEAPGPARAPLPG